MLRLTCQWLKCIKVRKVRIGNTEVSDRKGQGYYEDI